MNKLFIIDFSLKHTMECGQFFLYELIDDWYYIVNGENVFKVRQNRNILEFDGISKNDLIYFFSLDEDLRDVLGKVDDKHLLLAIEKYWGLHLLRQDLWQCIIGFVCSSASNIPKIQKNLRLIAEFFGSKVEFDGKEFYTFPCFEDIDDYDKLVEAKTGYRAKFIYDICQRFREEPELLAEIREADYVKAKSLLMSLSGIGSKVADCICLFGLGKKQAFPIDTWVKQIIEKLYLKRNAKNLKEIEEFIENYFKGHKGLKQQYLFHWARLNLK